MDKKDFIRFLNDPSWEDKKETAERLMEAELEKEPDQIDMEFVDLCMRYLTGAEAAALQEAPAKKPAPGRTRRKRVVLVRVLVAAVVAIVVTSIGFTAYAKANNMSLSDAFVSFFSDHATIDYADKKEGTAALPELTVPYSESDLYRQLQSGGIQDIYLPSAIYASDYSELEWTNDFTSNIAVFTTSLYDADFSVMIETFSDSQWVTNPDIQGEFTNSEKITGNGTDIYLFERDGGKKDVNTTITYQIGLTQYDIAGYCDIQEAKQLIESMNGESIQ